MRNAMGPLRLLLPGHLLLLTLLGTGCKTAPEPQPSVPERWDTPDTRRPLADWIQADVEPDSSTNPPPSTYAEAVYRVIHNHYEQFQTCYQAQLEAIPELYGDLVVVFEIDGDGTLRHPVVDFSSLQGPGIEPCVLEVLEGLALPKPPKDGFKVRYPMVFTSPVTPKEIVQVLKKRYRLETESEHEAKTQKKDDYEAPW